MANPTFFISDVHLTLLDDEKEHQRRRRLFDFFDTVKESHGDLIIGGDFFDFWFEYFHVIPKHYFDVLIQLHQLRQAGIEIHFIVGNHDYWTNDFLSQKLGMQVHLTDALMNIDGRQFLITHGDGLLDSDRGYRVLRKVLRNPVTIFLYRWLHPDLGIALAHYASRQSRNHHPQEDEDAAESMYTNLREYAKTQWSRGIDFVVVGHYHLNRIEHTNEGKGFLCMGDWVKHFTYGKFADGRLSLESWPE